MISPLRVLLLCALLLLSWPSASTSSSFSPSAADTTSSMPETFMRIDPSVDSQQAELPYSPTAMAAPAQTYSSQSPPAGRADSMEGAANGTVGTHDVSGTEEEGSTGGHTMHPMQSSAEVTMELRTNNAPWSPRIQPGLMYRTREINYLQVGTGLRVRLGSGYLMMYEGAMTNRTGPNPITRSIENDVWVSNDDGQLTITATTRNTTTAQLPSPLAHTSSHALLIAAGTVVVAQV